ncbi:MAG: DNA mismatch repair endonuclease MutL [Planctomycetia bacterium]|nr:DNA mismatch repair endonuclease MutL [Planctomycetia bacterium]
MARIQTLPVSVVNRIAAGEVVERPASVVKELLENALDARPARIDVALEQGGIGLVRVVDDGCGIEADDLPLAVAPHATSKLRVAEDLERIETLGFRGEALASVGEVARLVIRSRTAGAGAGAALEVDNGSRGAVTPCGGPVGTIVEVHQLFAKVPARRAFLRAAATEWSHAAEAFVRTALAHAGVALALEHNGRRVHDLPATDSWRTRIGGLFGEAFADRLVEVEGRDGDVAFAGFVGRPDDDMASGRFQHLFVAGRPFRDRSVLHAVQEAYRGLLLSGRQPIVFLRLSLPPEAVDVNVHPAKMEVRFRDPSRIYRLVLSTLRSTFLATDLSARLDPPPAAPAAGWGTAPAAARGALSAFAPFPLHAPVADRVARSPSPGIEPARAPWDEEAAAAAAAGAETAVQMHDRYLVVESPDGIEVIDQHALHERVLYERLRESVASGALEVQRLLVPETVDLTPGELELVGEHAAALARAGMAVEPFGGGTVIVTSKPALAGDVPAATLVREVLGRLAAAATSAGMLVDEILHGLACKAAIKAGDPLSQAEVDALVRDRRRVRDSHHCPHGRPTSLTLSRQELDRQFRRT